MRTATRRFVQNLDDVRHALAVAPTFDAGAKLQHAAGIRGDNAVRAGRVDRLHFLFEQRHRHIGVHDVVDPGAAAAQIRTVAFP